MSSKRAVTMSVTKTYQHVWMVENTDSDKDAVEKIESAIQDTGGYMFENIAVENLEYTLVCGDETIESDN